MSSLEVGVGHNLTHKNAIVKKQIKTIQLKINLDSRIFLFPLLLFHPV